MLDSLTKGGYCVIMDMTNNEKIIWIDDRCIQLKGMEDVTVTFAENETPGLVDMILGMVIQGART